MADYIADQGKKSVAIIYNVGDEYSKGITEAFVEEAKAAGFENLKGHRSVGGMRASIYNAMPYEGVEALVNFMAEFEKKH